MSEHLNETIFQYFRQGGTREEIQELLDAAIAKYKKETEEKIAREENLIASRQLAAEALTEYLNILDLGKDFKFSAEEVYDTMEKIERNLPRDIKIIAKFF